MANDVLFWVPWVPLIGALICGLCCCRPAWRGYAGVACVVSIAVSFVLVLPALMRFSLDPATGSDAPAGYTVPGFEWIAVNGFGVGFDYWIDGLTLLMLSVVTGIGLLIAIYATGYMKGDRGYARFFAGVSLFIFAMTTLVMADNLVLLYLGWEGVGLCSYLLIGYYYDRDEAVQAAKKAFIVNRIGDVGFVLGIFATWFAFGTVHIPTLLEQARAIAPEAATATMVAIPFLLMLGAFGKSAQVPLHTWLPDAMAGPTPVSALVHAATMVTAGVYMIARLFPVFELSPWALPTVAIVGGFTAIFAATIALCQYDLKKIYAYSTVSQLGYMFLGVGVASTFGGVFHLFTHAFFKALLFLTAGSVMHAMAGQLDLRKMSGLRHKMPVTAVLMLVGCLALAGLPPFAGFFSKDAILAAAMMKGGTLYTLLAVVGLVTAFITAFYTFRLWFRVFTGPEHYEMGDEGHAEELEHTAQDSEAVAAADPNRAPAHAHHAAPHEMPWWPMNLPLVILALGAVFAGFLGTDLLGANWVGGLIDNSTARVAHADDHHPAGEGIDPHLLAMILSSIAAVAGIALAWFFHLRNRPAADRVAGSAKPVVNLLYRKYYVDELYDKAIVLPLRVVGYVSWVVDEFLVANLARAVGYLPMLLGYGVRPTAHGRLQGYGLGMVGGAALIAILLIFALARSGAPAA